MGAERLILVDPKCEFTFAAQQAAASGQHGLQNRIIYKNWQEFFSHEKDGLRFGFTAKDGKLRQVRDFNEALQWIKTSEPQMQEQTDIPIPIYLIFGPEDWGLSNSDLELTHFNVAIPTYGDNSSLNLAQAVLIGLFMLRQSWGGEKAIFESQQDRQLVESQSDRQDIFPEKALELWLREMGFDVADRKMNAYSVMKRLLLHNVPSKKELRILDIVLHQGIRKLREYNELRQQAGLPFTDSEKKH